MTQGDAITYLRQVAAQTLPQGYLIDYAGSRAIRQDNRAVPDAAAVARIVIFLVLAACSRASAIPLSSSSRCRCRSPAALRVWDTWSADCTCSSPT
jgi:hypothetical protein